MANAPADLERFERAARAQPGAVERAGGMIKFPCPACRLEGFDEPGDNAAYFVATGTWGCAWAKDTPLGRPHWDAIGHVLGAFTANGHKPSPWLPADLDPAVLHDEPLIPTAAPAVIHARAPGFIGRYVAIAQERTDAPAEAHELAAVVVLSALAGPRVRIPLAYRADGVRLVLWGMNVVDSTSGRKTTVNEFGVDVIRQVLGEDAILPWKGSPESFIQALGQRDGHAAVFARDEYSGLLAQMKKGGYVAGLGQDFIRAYDGLPITMARTAKMNRKTGQRVDDTDRVRDPFLVKLCAATRTSFIETATVEDVLDGLLARFTFTSGVAEEQRPRLMTPALEEAWRDVIVLAQRFADCE